MNLFNTEISVSKLLVFVWH